MMGRSQTARPWGLGLLAGLVLGLVSVALAPVALAIERQELAYVVSFGPLTALNVTTTIDLTPERYRVEATVAPRAWIAWALPWQAHSEVNGQRQADGSLQPNDYLATAQWGVRLRKTALTYVAGNVHVALDPPGDNDGREVVPPELITDSLDPVSAVLSLMAAVADGHRCPLNLPVFDGHRRFDLATETLPGTVTASDRAGLPADLSHQIGPITVCRLHFRSLAGGWRNGERAQFWRTDHPGSERPPIDLWLAPLSESALPVPIQVTGGSAFGWVTVTLSSHSLKPWP